MEYDKESEAGGMIKMVEYTNGVCRRLGIKREDPGRASPSKAEMQSIYFKLDAVLSENEKLERELQTLRGEGGILSAEVESQPEEA